MGEFRESRLPNRLTEIEKVQNPAFCSFLLWKFGRGYQQTLIQEPANLLLYFLVLPICLHSPSLDKLVSTQLRSGLGKFVEKMNKEREELLAIHERALILRELTLNSIAFGVRANILHPDYQLGTLRAFDVNPPKIPQLIKRHERAAERLGLWFSTLPSAQVFQILKVEA